MSAEREKDWQESSKHLRDSHTGPGIRDAAKGTVTRAELRSGEGLAQHIVDTVHDALLVLNRDFRVEAANRAYYEIFQTSPEETLKRSIFEFMDAQWDTLRLRELLEEILPEDEELEDFEIEQRFEGLGQRVLLLNARQLDEHDLILLAIEDVTEERRAMQELAVLNEELEERVRERTRQVRSLASALSEAEEQERERVADMLHDFIQQQLFGIELLLRQIRGRTEALPEMELKTELEKLLDRAEGIFDEAQEAARTLSAELSPPVARGESLEAAFEWLAGHFKERYGLTVGVALAEDFHLGDEALRRFLFQLVRELLFNVVKHAEAEEAQIRGRRTERTLLLEVSDGGKGFEKAEIFDERPEGRGLRAMQNRLELLGGYLDIDAAPGEGTHITASLPAEAVEE